MRGEKGAQAGLRPAARAGRPFVADLPTDPGRGTGIGCDGGGMVVGLDLDQNVGLARAVAIAKALVRAEDRHGKSLDYAGVVGIRLNRALGVGGVRVANHVEERVRLALAVDDPIGVENFMAAVLGVDHRKHH